MKYFWIYMLLGCPLLLPAQEKIHRVVFYNVENLFDTVDDPAVADEEFTPAGAKHWTERRYQDKLAKMAQVIREAGMGRLPLIVGLAEVENRRVLSDLTGWPDLQKGGYGIIHRDSPDARGIDVALLYRKSFFRPLRSEFFKVDFPTNPALSTRDILYVAGVLGADTLHFFVCHFPSMSGGEKKSEWKRVRAAEVLRFRLDSIRRFNSLAKIVVMGDFNGQADREAQRVIGVGNSDQGPNQGNALYNTGYYLLGKEQGSYRYRGKWQTLDHIIVSGSLLGNRGAWNADKRLTVFTAPFLLEEDRKYSGRKPFPTYRGPFYCGGYSDHLPVYIDLHMILKK